MDLPDDQFYDYMFLQLSLVQLTLIKVHLRRESAARRPARRQRVWVRTGLRDRVGQGFYDNLLRDLPLNDPDIYFNFMRMDSTMFRELLARVGPKIAQQDTNFRDALQPAFASPSLCTSWLRGTAT